MGKRCREEADPDGAATAAEAAAPSNNTLFIDTNIDTHLAMIVSDSDTVADLKKKIVLEHPSCFPKLGEIEIHALKVKRKGYFYHLSDSMLVSSAFEGAKKSWFISVDASCLKEHDENRHILKPDADNQLALVCIPNNQLGDGHDIFVKYMSKKFPALHNSANKLSPWASCGEVSEDVEMEMNNITYGHSKDFPSGTNKRSDLETQKYDFTSKWNKNLEMAAYQKNENSENFTENSENVTGHVFDSDCVEQSLKTEPSAKKIRKTRKKNEEHSASFSAASMDQLCPVTAFPENSLVNGDKEDSDEKNYIIEEGHLTTSSGSKKRKQRKVRDNSSVLLNEVATVVPSMMQDVPLDEPSEIPLINETGDRVLELPRNGTSSASIGTIFEADVGNTYGKSNKTKQAAEEGDGHLTTCSGRKKRKMRKVKDNSSVPQNEVASVVPSMMPDETLDEASKIPLINEPGVHVLELPRNGASSASFGTIFEPDAGNTYGKSDATKQAAEEKGHLTSCSDSKKRKMRKVKDTSSVPQNEVATVVPSMLQDEPLDEASKIPLINKPGDPVSKVPRNGVSSSSIGTIFERDAGNTYGKSDATKQAAEISKKGTTYLRNHHSTIVKQIDEHHYLREDVCSAHENAVPDDHNVEAEQQDEVEEKSNLSAYHGPEVMLREDIKPPSEVVAGANFNEPMLSARFDTSGKTEPGKSHGSKSEKRTKSTVRNQAVLDVEHPIVSKKGNANSMSDPASEAKMDNSFFSESESDKPGKIQEETELLVNPICEIMTFQKSNVKNQVEEDVISKEPDLAAKSSGLKEVVQSIERKKIRAKKPAARNQEASAMEHCGIHVGVTSSINEIMKNDGILVHTENEGLGRRKSGITTVRTNNPEDLTRMNQAEETGDIADKELGKNGKKNQSTGSHPDLSIDKQINGVECLQLNQISNIQEDAEVSNKKQKKRKMKRNSAAKSQSDLPIEEQGLGLGSCDERGEIDNVSKDAKKTGISETEIEVGLGKVAGTGQSSLNVDQISNARGTPRAKVDNDNYVQVSKGESIDFKHYFVPGEHGEVAQADNLNKVNDIKTKKHTKKHVVPSVGASPDFQNSVKSHENQWTERKFQIEKPDCDELQQSSTDEHNESMLLHSKKSSKGSEDREKAPPKQLKISQETGQTDFVSGSGTSRLAKAFPNGKSLLLDASSSDQSSKNINIQWHQSNSVHKGFRKPSNVNLRLVTNNSQGWKTLLTTPATPGPILKKVIVESSAAENGTANSDASTRTPSNSSSSSDLSEGESDSSLDSARNGRKEDSGKNMKQYTSASTKNLTMDMIFRSSSSFKKARLTAAQ